MHNSKKLLNKSYELTKMFPFSEDNNIANAVYHGWDKVGLTPEDSSDFIGNTPLQRLRNLL